MKLKRQTIKKNNASLAYKIYKQNIHMDDKLFSFKQKSQDFIVTEELPFTLANS